MERNRTSLFRKCFETTKEGTAEKIKEPEGQREATEEWKRKSTEMMRTGNATNLVALEMI